MASIFMPILLLLLFVFLIIRRKFSKPQNLPPGPKPWPIIGNLLDMGDKPHIALAHLAEGHGPLISLRLGTQLLVVGSSPAAAVEILKTSDQKLSGRHVPHVSFAKDPEKNRESIAWTFECSEEWKSLRSLMRNELFSSKVIDNQSIIREKKVRQLINYLGSKAGEPVQIRQPLFVNTFNSLANIYFSRDFMGFEGKDSKRVGGLVREMMETWSAPNISDFYPILGGFDLQGMRRKSDQCVKKMRGIWDEIIMERRKSRNAKSGFFDVDGFRDFLDVLLDCGYSDDQISFLFVEMLAAVSDSTTATVEWAMSELMMNKEAMTKIRQELEQEIQGNIITESDLAKFPYFIACFKETLRLHPPAPLLLPHRATETCQVMNYTVPKDTQVFVNVWAIGRDPTLWDDPLSFRPERFLNSDLDYKGNHYQYLPFGSGRRICAGLPMASRQVQLVLANLIRHFDWSLPSYMASRKLDMAENFGVTLQKEEPLLLVPKLKKSYTKSI